MGRPEVAKVWRVNKGVATFLGNGVVASGLSGLSPFHHLPKREIDIKIDIPVDRTITV